MTKHENWLKKLQLKEVEVHMGMFDFSINIVIGKYESVNEYVRFKLDDEYFDVADFDGGYGSRGKCIYRSGYRPIIWIPKYPTKPREYATLAHESLHAMYHVQRWANFELSDETEEVMTHGVAHIINVVLESK